MIGHIKPNHQKVVKTMSQVNQKLYMQQYSVQLLPFGNSMLKQPKGKKEAGSMSSRSEQIFSILEKNAAES